MDKLKEIKSNINSIKSTYILKEVFSFLYEKQKLNVIIYNKKLQKKLDVDIEEYKKISGKYKVGEKNGKGKEYELNTNKLIFEGEYINGKRNGKGKEYYYNGNLKFEGEYLNGKIWNGNGKKYYYNDKLKFDEEYINGKKNGKGKEYDFDGKLKFEGEYLNGKIWNGKGYDKIGNIEFEIKEGKGKVKEYNYDGKLLFEGEYINGKRNRKGTEYDYDELLFKG